MESFPDYVYEDEDFPEVEIDISSIEPYQFEPILNQSESQGSEDESDSDGCLESSDPRNLRPQTSETSDPRNLRPQKPQTYSS